MGIDYAKEMERIRKEMKELLVREAESRNMLEKAFSGIGYGIGPRDSGEYMVAENQDRAYGQKEKESE